MRDQRQAPTAPSNGARPPVEERLDHEELLVRRGERTGLYVVVAIHSTALGPALGGARLWSYATPGDGIADALRLSEAMTYKAAAAGLDLGGGKSVLCVERGLSIGRRRDLMLDLGDAVQTLEGRYVVAEDVGTNADDMTVVAERTSHVVGLPVEQGGSGDPSPVTARGVDAAMRATCERRLGSPELDRVRVCVIGLGHVGARLAERLADGGARLSVSDIDPGKRRLAERLGATWVAPERAALADCDVLAPCALGGVIDRANVAQLRCRAVCGSANNVLEDDSVAEELHRRGILYAPDFIANSGGLINVYGEMQGLQEGRVRELVDGIGPTLEAVFEEAEERSITPLAAARELAAVRLERARGVAEPARLGT
jgi:leucine dehydrogenase